MLEHLGWGEAATLVERALRGVIADRTVTPDLAADMPGARAVSCSEFGRLLVDKIAVSAS